MSNEFIVPKADFQSLNPFVVIVAEKRQKSLNLLNLKGQLSYIALALLLVLIKTNNIYELLFNSLSLVGIFTTILIFFKENDINSLADRFCSNTKSSSCELVLNSTGSKIYRDVKLSDLSLVYFSLIFFVLIFKGELNSVALFTILALLIVPFSLIQQVFVIKKICPLCLTIVGVLLVQSSIVFFTATSNLLNIENVDLSRTSMLAVLIIIGWSSCRKYVLRYHKLKVESLSNLRFKRNPDLFFAYFNSLPMLNTLLFETSVIIGDSDAPIEIIAVLNPLCKPCAAAFDILANTVTKFKKEVCLKICFHISPESSEDPRNLIAGDLLFSCIDKSSDYIFEVVNNWYKKQIIPYHNSPNNQSVKKYLNSCLHFRLSNKINLSPTIIINRKTFPVIYDTDSLHWLMPYLINKVEINDSILT